MKNTKDTIDGHMSEHGMQFMVIALAHVIWRNTIVEDLHTENAVLDGATMKILNKEICNRIYSVIRILVDGTPEERTALNESLAFGYECGIT